MHSPWPPADPAGLARHGGADALSLALIDARNHTLQWLAAFEAAGPDAARQACAGLPPALWLAGHAGWWQEFWILRNVLAQRGDAADPQRPRLASIDPQADQRWHADGRARAATGAVALPDAGSVRAYMTDTLESVLDLLLRSAGDDQALYFHRQALRHEDRCSETLAVLAQASGLDGHAAAGAAGAVLPGPPACMDRAPLLLPAQRFMLGSAPGGLVPGAERWAHEEALPECEIDAQVVSWGRYLEFAEDGGYDQECWWTADGWAWAQAAQRRAPRYVEQLRQAVVLQRQGRLQRVPAGQPAVHVTRHEAQAWCAWAGRRLPTELEWEAAACTAAGRGFVWGAVYEWVGGRARGWPGHADPPAEIDPLPAVAGAAGAAVLRGASWLTPARAVHPKARRFAAPDDDLLPVGFRSCAH